MGNTQSLNANDCLNFIFIFSIFHIETHVILKLIQSSCTKLIVLNIFFIS